MQKTLKLFVLLCLLLCLVTGKSYAVGVQKGISLSFKNETLVKVLGEIRKQSGLNFIYKEKVLEGINNITVNVKNVTLTDALDACLKGTSLTYKIENNIIVVFTKIAEKKVIKPRKIHGVVVDDTGLPLPGVVVGISNKPIGVYTDIDGKFNLEITPDVKMLEFLFVGMKTIKMPIPKDDKLINIVMQMEAGELNDVIVTGYTKTTRRKITGSVAVVSKETFKNKAIPTVDRLLQGQVAGVTTKSSGRPGQAAKIRIRGTNTITGNAEPLWVIDGVAMQKDIPDIQTSQINSGDFNNIFQTGIGGVNPNDIESVTVLKDASATAIYGSRAAGGVIVVTTKKGKAGKMSINYSSNFSIILKPSRSANLMNSSEKLSWEQQLWDEFSAGEYNLWDKASAENKKDYYFPVIGITGMVRAGKEQFAGMTKAEQDRYLNDLSNNSTDWFDELFRNSVSQSHYLSVSGGGDKYNYYVSGGYSDNLGLVKKTDYSRYNFNGKINVRPVENLSLGFIFDMSKQESNGPSMNVNPFQYAYFANPYEKLYNADGSYARDNTYFSLKSNNGGYVVPQPENGFNIMREMNETSTIANNMSTNIKFDLTYHITEKLQFSGLVAYSFTNNESKNINGKESYAAYTDRLSFEKIRSKRTYGSITQASANNSSYSARGQFVYNDKINDDNKYSFLIGTEIRGQKANSIYAKRYGYDSVTGNSSIPIPVRTGDKIDYTQLKAYADIVDGLSGQSITEDRFASFYSSFDYHLLDKYVASFSFRTDGSNNFGSDQQFNPTWSAGGAWHILSEPFMENLTDVLSTLTLRLATGYTGNMNKSIYPQLMMYYQPSFRKTDLENYRMGSIRNAPNPNLRWEKTQDYKASVSFGFLDNRISGVIESYYRRSTDVVSLVTVPTSTGFSRQSFNTSEIENKGIEFSINAQLYKSDDFKLSTSINFAYNANKLLKYDSHSGSDAHNTVGYPLGSIFGGKTTGIDPATGIYKFKLRKDAVINSNKDLKEYSNYLFYLGTSTAPYNGGFSINAQYKSFSLNIGGSYAIGANIIDNLTSPVSYSTIEKGSGNTQSQYESIPTKYNDIFSSHLNVRNDVTDRWISSGDSGKYPRLINYFGDKLFLDSNNPISSQITNGALLENVSYLKVNNISLSYSLPSDFLKRYNISSLGLNFSVSNLFTITNFSGIDPENPGAQYPTSRSITFGVNVGF